MVEITQLTFSSLYTEFLMTVAIFLDRDTSTTFVLAPPPKLLIKELITHHDEPIR